MSSTLTEKKEEEVVRLLEMYFLKFQSYFEATIKSYCEKMNEKTERKEINIDNVQQCVEAFAQIAANPTKVVEYVIPAVFKTAVEIFNINKEKKLLNEIAPLIVDAKIDDEGTKERLAAACFEIFKAYELIFANVYVIRQPGDPLSSMSILAQEAVLALVKYLILHHHEGQGLTEDAVVEAIRTIEHKSSNVFLAYLDKVYTEVASIISRNTDDLRIAKGEESLTALKIYSKVGLIDSNGDFYKRKEKNRSHTSKYGYRYLFNEETVSSEFEKESNHFPIKDYQAVLPTLDKQEVIKKMIKHCEKTNDREIEEIKKKIDDQVEELRNVCEQWGKQNINIEGNDIEDFQAEITQKQNKGDQTFQTTKNKIKTFKLTANQH